MPTPIYVSVILWTAYLLSLYFAVFWFLVFTGKKPEIRKKPLAGYPCVSIAVPAYNEEETIIPTLASLTGLNYPADKLEIIVINDGSGDNTKNAVEDFISQNKAYDIKLINKKNEGKGAALNRALGVCRGEFFICLDADSVVTKDALIKTLPYFTDDNIAVVLPLLKVDKPKNLWQKMQWREYIVNMFYKSLMGRLDCVHVAPGPFSVYKKAIIQKIGGFDQNNLTEDLEITLRLQSRHYKVVQLLDVEVHTKAPESFKELYRQRNRWYKGSIINAVKYRKMLFNRQYGDFGFIQMPTIFISGTIAILLFSSMVYYGLKPYIKAIYHSIFIDFDFYTLIKTFQFDFNILDINYMRILLAAIMLAISITMLKKAHGETNEKSSNHSAVSLALYLFFYFLVIGFIWVGIILDFALGRKQKW